MTDEQENGRKTHKLRGAKNAAKDAAKDASDRAKTTAANMLSHSVNLVEPITKLGDEIEFSREYLLARLHDEMRSEREQVESTLFPGSSPKGKIDYTPLSDVAIRHARRAELVSALTNEDLQDVESIARAICDGRISDLETFLSQIDSTKIERLSEALGLILRTDSFWIGVANGWLHFLNKDSGRYFSYPIGAIDLCPPSSESRIEKSAS